MLSYQLRVAAKSLRRDPGHAALVVAGIALGVAVATIFSAIHHTFARDPVPGKSASLYYVRLDSWGAGKPHPNASGLPPQITYRDAMALTKSDIPARQSAMYKAALNVFPDPARAQPSKESVRLCTSDFFPMFDAPFEYGSGWDKKADEGPEPVVVLSRALNERLFGGANSVGQRLRIEEREFRVAGVLGRWRSSVKFYDLTQGGPAGPPDGLFLPLAFARPMQIRTDGNTDGWMSAPAPGFEGFLASETTWMQLWVELPTAERAAAYRSFLDAYVSEQKRLGRFPRPPNNRLTPLLEWMREQNAVPPETTAMMAVSLLFLAVCALNLMGLLMAKFLARAPEIGVRRALGARRLDVFVQHVLECEVVALAGGALGFGAAAVGLFGVNALAKTIIQRGDLFGLDLTMAAFAAAASLAAGLIAGVYPALRACRVPPA
ncbi:MAG TPA: ABC transporter permease, partial [Polyangiaceae bacterium]|nr:ABC transporter permease [Polyangiaceae bacterium]